MFQKSYKIPTQVKSEVTDACVDLCCQDLRPFDIVSGDGFRAVAQSLINVGARYGRVDASSARPHRQTVCDRAKATATDKKEILAKEINKALDCGIAITSDHCGLTITTHGRTPHLPTVYNLHEQGIEELHDFGIEPERLPKVMFVSDQTANINAALRSHKWMPCAAHVINIVLKHTFDVTPAYMHDVSHVIDKCKSLVTYLKKSSAVVHLPHAVIQEFEEPERAKRKRDEFSEWEDYGEEDGEKDEVQRYIDSQFLWDGDDLLNFWESQSKAFPLLAKVARMILYIPATICELLFVKIDAVVRAGWSGSN
ncbi:Transposable element Hobo transposase [Solea senegalensis]|uniref:Transposable element Hobo transposase n=1 Tax=Solea senegalensis TaxID=28829 RepID=A0AAV6QN15_SOLSE|nr:Transposable element Hobo transposase [Solea senegalensis]